MKSIFLQLNEFELNKLNKNTIVEKKIPNNLVERYDGVTEVHTKELISGNKFIFEAKFEKGTLSIFPKHHRPIKDDKYSYTVGLKNKVLKLFEQKYDLDVDDKWDKMIDNFNFEQLKLKIINYFKNNKETVPIEIKDATQEFELEQALKDKQEFDDFVDSEWQDLENLDENEFDSYEPGEDDDDFDDDDLHVDDDEIGSETPCPKCGQPMNQVKVNAFYCENCDKTWDSRDLDECSKMKESEYEDDAENLRRPKAIEDENPNMNENGKNVTGYELTCPNCGTTFEKDVDEVGLEPFITECPECGQDVGSEHASELTDTSKKKDELEEVKTPEGSLLSILNKLGQGKTFGASGGGKVLTSVELGTASLEHVKTRKGTNDAIVLNNNDGTFYFVEPFDIKTYPESGKQLFFTCSAIYEKYNEETENRLTWNDVQLWSNEEEVEVKDKEYNVAGKVINIYPDFIVVDFDGNEAYYDSDNIDNLERVK